METIANRIKQGLSIRNMKQADLVEKTKIGKSSISTYISGAYEPKQRNIYKIAKALNVNEAWLMGYDVPMERETSKIINQDDKATSMINYNLEQYIQSLGFNIIADEAEGNLILATKEAEYEITLSDLESFENTTESFIKFKLSEIMNKSSKFNKNTKVVDLPAKKKEMWEEPGKEYLMPIASHDRNGEFTEEDYKHDDDLMDNEDLWK